MRRLAVVIVLALSALFPASASAVLVLLGDSTTTPGEIGLAVIGSSTLTDIEAGEIVKGTYVPIVPRFDLSIAGDLAYGRDATAAPWLCDRRTRDFIAYGHDAQGNTESGTFTVRTPSCKTRLSLEVPPRVRTGASVPVKLRDSWGAGDVSARFCRKPPLGAYACRLITIPPGQTSTTASFRADTKGRWRIAVGAPAQRIARVVSVGVKPRPRDLALLPGVLTTGDSMMQSLDSVLGDRLVGRAQLFSDVYISSGLTKPAIVDWSKLPTQQVSEDHPKAAILFLGANEAGPLGDIECCGPDWIAEYARQARRMMHTYLQDGDGSVLWLNNPVPRDERRAPSMAAVNKGLARAARGLDRVRILDMAKLFTPGGVYRDNMRYDGKVIRVRQDDGIHLTIPGARIAATVVLRELHALGVI